jgi:BMFP domain-containing protein YqiC
MTENMSDNSPTMKKRKANDGRATVPGSHHSGGGFLSSWLGYFSSGQRDNTPPTASTTCGGENLTQMDRMENMMLKMEEKLTTMSSLESRCANLEAKCNKLEHMLETKTSSMKEHVDSKISSLVRHHEYNTMLVKNQSWEYSTPAHSQVYWEDDGYDEDIAQYLSENSECLKECSIALRRGEFPENYFDEKKGIRLCWDEGDPILDRAARDIMRPHWCEFVMSLKQFTPAFGVLPDGCETYFTLENIQLDRYLPRLLKDALMHKPFQSLSFVNKAGVGDDEGMTIDSIMDIMNSNKHLQKLRIGNNHIQLDHIAKICSAVHEHSLVELDLRNCFENGLGDAMVTSLLTSGGLMKLEKLCLTANGITSSSIALLACFLATNAMLKYLDLDGNGLNDNDALVLANALRSNTSLGYLRLYDNDISDAGDEAFDLVLHGDGNLNSISDSNHSCSVVLKMNCWNVYEKPDSFNRARKIYRLLSARNKSMSTSNVQHFDDIDVKILPTMLKAVQRYASDVCPYDRFKSGYCRVEPLSIVYEVMRKWDKVFPLYTDGGDNDNGSSIE